MTALLEVRNLVKRYGNLLVTDSVSLDIHMGEIHAIIGPNGAGKTTLTNQITGGLRSDSGQVLFQGADVTHWSVAKRARAGMGRSYQINSIIPSFTVLENVLLAVQAAEGHNWYFWQPATQIPHLRDKALAIIEMLGLQDVQNAISEELSYGQQRQIELAMALAVRPKLLLLDEPMAGLGTAETEHMMEILNSIRSNYGILLIEHDMQAVFALADRISVLVNGAVAVEGTPEEIRNSALVREAYLGEEELIDE
ncbi:MAG TPA: ABC transporter ATP-binding protein [Burkholderiaceae bacterium]|nr:ABC transporter ATP-binding protein [Burkholderiaceae bacterium]